MSILRGEIDLPSAHVFPEVLQFFRRLSDNSRLTRSRFWTYRKSRGTGDGDNVPSLSHHPRQGDLASSCVVLLPNLLQAIREFEDVGEVLLRVPSDVFAEVAVLKVVGRFLRKIERVGLLLHGDN